MYTRYNNIPGSHLVTVLTCWLFGKHTGQTKVSNLKMTALTDQEISGLEILSVVNMAADVLIAADADPVHYGVLV